MTAPPLRLATIVGTRPEAIKLMPVIVAARERPAQFEVEIVRTGQHGDMVDRLMDEFGLVADVDLHVMKTNQDLAHVLAASVRGLSDCLSRTRPDWVLVQGDTATTFAGALAAFYNRVRIGHVEAGLRTGNLRLPFPEEANRALTARLADLHFAPTEPARGNLIREGIDASTIVVTGNTVVDALQRTLQRPRAAATAEARGPATDRYALVTVHRRESHGAALGRICDALLLLLERHPDLSVRLPMHPSPIVRATLLERLGRHPRVRLCEPMGYTQFVDALAGAALVLTDSGGVQEECAALGKPVLVLREDTERLEAVEAGVAVVVGTDALPIATLASELLADPGRYAAMAHRSEVFGDGRAAGRILEALLRAGPTRRDAPTPAGSTATR